MSQKDVAFALELVARALSGRVGTDPEDSSDVTTYTLEDVARELTEYAEMLNTAPAQTPGDPMCRWIDPEDRFVESARCAYHPLGGPDCSYR